MKPFRSFKQLIEGRRARLGIGLIVALFLVDGCKPAEKPADPAPAPSEEAPDAVDEAQVSAERETMLGYVHELEALSQELEARYDYCKTHNFGSDNGPAWRDWCTLWNDRRLAVIERHKAEFGSSVSKYPGSFQEAWMDIQLLAKYVEMLQHEFDNDLGGAPASIQSWKKTLKIQSAAAKKNLR